MPIDNSGQRLSGPGWQTSSSNIARTNAIIKTLANTYKDDTTVTVIAPLNVCELIVCAKSLDFTDTYQQEPGR
jgi:hypothetical protein